MIAYTIPYASPAIAVFTVAALLMLGGAVGVLRAKNPVHAALSLILSLFGVALAFLAQQADFLAAIEIIVYAGAIVVLFLFVIMFLGTQQDGTATTAPLVGQRTVAGVAVALVVAGVVFLMQSSHWVTGVPSVATNENGLTSGSDNIHQIGAAVYTTYLVAFEVTAALLIIAVVGAVNLARRERPRVGEEA